MINTSDTYEIELTLYEADGVTVLDFSAAAGLLLAIYQKPGNIVGKYSKNVKSGFTTLTVGQLAASNLGKVTLYLQTSESVKLDPEKKVYAEARVSFTNANYSGNLQTLTATDIELEPVKRPQLENIATT